MRNYYILWQFIFLHNYNVGSSRLELETSSMSTKRSNQLSYEPKRKYVNLLSRAMNSLLLNHILRENASSEFANGEKICYI